MLSAVRIQLILQTGNTGNAAAGYSYKYFAQLHPKETKKSLEGCILSP